MNKPVRMLVSVALVGIAMFLSFGAGESKGRREALRQSADAWVSFVYADDAGRPVGELPNHVTAELKRANVDYGKLDEVEIYRVEDGPAKTFIRLHVMRGEKMYVEEILLIGGKLRDFTSEPAQ